MTKLINRIGILALLFFTFSQTLFSQRYLQRRVDDARAEGADFVEVSPFNSTNYSINQDPDITRVLKSGKVLALNLDNIDPVLGLQPEAISVEMPDGSGGTVTLDMVKHTPLSTDFQCILHSTQYPGGQQAIFETGVHYNGVVRGVMGGICSVSFFEGEIMGFFSTPTRGNYVFGKIRQGVLAGNTLLYSESDLSMPNPFRCVETGALPGGGGSGSGIEILTGNGNDGEIVNRCVRAHIEIDYSFYQHHAGNGEPWFYAYAAGMFSQISTLYLNEQIVFELTGVTLWTSASPYSTIADGPGLNTFESNTENFTGHLKQLWVYNPSQGGIGELPLTMCPGKNYSMGNVFGNYSNVPVYSWDVFMSTHEFGHNLTCKHTQSCSWPGGAIDDCYETEGPCDPGPTPVTGGTIMSYCHLAPSGINFSNGFGPLPGQKIRNAVDGAWCLTDCAPKPCTGFVGYVPIPGTAYMYAVVNVNGKGDLIKVLAPGGAGHNMFAIQWTGGGYSGVPGYPYFIGSQKFKHEITKVIYTGSQTIVALKDGKMLKVNGTGGTGTNMFAVNENPGDFTPIPGYFYYVGDAKFNGYCTDMFYGGGYLLMGFSNKKMLKVNGTGGGGHNMFAVEESNSNFSSVPGYNYYAGSHKFLSVPVRFLYNGTHTLTAFNSGKILKVSGTGGTGMNLFAINETWNDFTGVIGYPYYAGDAKFSGVITTWKFSFGQLLMGFNNTKMLKVQGLGGGGDNMFAVYENANDFSSVPGYYYYIGDANFDSPPTDIEVVGVNQTLVSFVDEKILKVSQFGGGGHNMFAVTENANSFSPVPGYNYYVGDQNFIQGYPTDLLYYRDHTFVGLSNLWGLKIEKEGGSGNNMYALVEVVNGFGSLLGYNYYVGDQIFECRPKWGNGKTDETVSHPDVALTEDATVSAYPNPTDGVLNVRFSEVQEKFVLKVYNSTGQLMIQSRGDNAAEATLDLSSFASGVYMVEAETSSGVQRMRVVLGH